MGIEQVVRLAETEHRARAGGIVRPAVRVDRVLALALSLVLPVSVAFFPTVLIFLTLVHILMQRCAPRARCAESGSERDREKESESGERAAMEAEKVRKCAR